MSIIQLGYVAISVSDMAAWLDTATGILGAEVRDEVGDGGARYLRLDGMHHRIVLQPGDVDDVLWAGWQVASDAELERLADELAALGLLIGRGTPQECAERQVGAMIKFRDPEGYANELYVRPIHDGRPVCPSLPISGFNAGRIGFGHIVRHCKQYRQMVDFYREVFGFKVSDYILWADMDATFLRCNPRHHSLALLNESLGHEGGQTNHLMIEVGSIDDVGRAYDEVLRRKLPVIMTLGRHGNDNTTSFYFVGPSGFGIEIGTGGVLIDDDDEWDVRTFNSTKIWGHLLPHERGEGTHP
jgi:2,3-dihydroxybiphenyl 1,2-dioxygenase